MDQSAGLLQGLAEGLRTGLGAYREEEDRQYKRNLERTKYAKEQQDAADRLGLLKEQRDIEKMKLGMKRDQEGNWVPDPESYVLKKQQSELQAAQQKGLLTGEQIKKTQAETQKAYAEAGKAKSQATGLLGQAKTAAQDQKEAAALEKHLSQGWAGRAGQAGQVQNKINAAEYAEGLIEQGKNQEGGLDSRQIEELAQSTARMLGGTGAASARVEALVPHTLFGRAQSLKEWLSGSPKGADMQQFVARMAETVAREKAIAQDQQRKYQIEGLGPFQALKQRNPDLYNSILQRKGIDESMIDEKGRYKKATSGGLLGGDKTITPPPQDPQVAAYAKQYGLDYNKAKSIIDKRRGQ